MRILRLSIVAATLGFFITWYLDEARRIAASIYEYVAVLFAMAYPPTWAPCRHEPEPSFSPLMAPGLQ